MFETKVNISRGSSVGLANVHDIYRATCTFFSLEVLVRVKDNHPSCVQPGANYHFHVHRGISLGKTMVLYRFFRS